MNNSRGCYPFDNATCKPIHDKNIIQVLFGEIWDNNFTKFINNFINQNKRMSGFSLIANDSWDDITDEGLIKFFLLVPWDKSET